MFLGEVYYVDGEEYLVISSKLITKRFHKYKKLWMSFKNMYQLNIVYEILNEKS